MNRPGPYRSSRRSVLVASLAVGIGAGRGAHAQSTASPDAGRGYARPEMLVDAGWLQDHLDDPLLRVVALMPAGTFSQGAIPGSVQIDWPDLEVTDTSDAALAAWRVTVEERLTTLGLAREQTVVVYDEGTLFAARLWWVLHELSHERVQILNGGLPAWIAAGYEVATDQPAVMAAAEPYQGSARPDAIAQVPEVEAAIDDPDTIIVDARTPDEYAAGHIPGAINVNYPLNAQPEAPRFWKPAGGLTLLYADAGIPPDRRVIPYCSTGVRSAVTYFTLHLMGYDDVSLFTGSWAEWILDPERPVTTGEAP